jgi:serine/threonine-protein kinase
MAGPDSDTVKASPATATQAGVPAVGDVIAEKYRVERVIGMGGMGVVLAVRHLTLGELYAMKFLLPGASQDREAVERFMREAKAAVRIKSEHIARVSDVGQIPGASPYIVMEYLQGADLGKYIDQAGIQDIATACDFLIQACAGLAEAHALGIVHRDLKPSNLFLTHRSDGTPLVKVLDFGISKAAADTNMPTITATQEVFGSPAYMSPEQIRSAKNVDVRSDIWSLGVILYELLTKHLPFDGDTSSALLAAISADDPKPLAAYRSDAGDPLDAILQRCLQKKPPQRFQSVSELATALAPFAGAETQSLVSRIARITSPSNVPQALSSAPSGPVSSPAAVAATERSWTTASRAVPARSSKGLIAAGVAGAFMAAMILVVVLVMQHNRAGIASSPSSAASVVAPDTATAATAHAATAPVASASVAPVASAQPVAAPSASASVSVSTPAADKPRFPNRERDPKRPLVPAANVPPPTTSVAPAPTPVPTNGDHALDTSH